MWICMFIDWIYLFNKYNNNFTFKFDQNTYKQNCFITWEQADTHTHNPQLTPAATTLPHASNKTFSSAMDERWFADAKFIYKGFLHPD